MAPGERQRALPPCRSAIPQARSPGDHAQLSTKLLLLYVFLLGWGLLLSPSPPFAHLLGASSVQE